MNTPEIYGLATVCSGLFGGMLANYWAGRNGQKTNDLKARELAQSLATETQKIARELEEKQSRSAAADRQEDRAAARELRDELRAERETDRARHEEERTELQKQIDTGSVERDVLINSVSAMERTVQDFDHERANYERRISDLQTAHDKQRELDKQKITALEQRVAELEAENHRVKERLNGIP